MPTLVAAWAASFRPRRRENPLSSDLVRGANSYAIGHTRWPVHCVCHAEALRHVASHRVQESARCIRPDNAAARLIDDAPVRRQLEVWIAMIEGSSIHRFKGLFVLKAERFGGLHHGARVRAGVHAAALEKELLARNTVPCVPAFIAGCGHADVDRALMRDAAEDSRVSMRRAALVQRGKLFDASDLESALGKCGMRCCCRQCPVPAR
jgi:hypothetical protein